MNFTQQDMITLLVAVITVSGFGYAVYRIAFTDRYVSKYYTPINTFKLGDKVKCINGKFEGEEGTVSQFSPNKYGKFCMRVDPDVGERVNPDNWIEHK